MKSLIKKDPAKQALFEEKFRLFLIDPYHPRLETHKLKGRLKGYLTFTVEYDLRVVFYFENESEVVFVNIGSHDEVY